MDETMSFIPNNDPFVVYLAESLPPYTTPALTANLVLRVALGILANLLCLVPLRLLYRNHELAAVVFIINIGFKNILTVVSALIWRNDNMENWWAGYGLCDFASFANNFSFGLFDTCMLAIMRNLAHQANLLSAHPLSVREKRRRNLVHVLIMFPLPLAQIGWTWFLTGQRYVIGTLTGCIWVQYPSWPYVVFFALPPLVLSVVTVGYAVLTIIRFRRVTRSAEPVLSSSNRVANYRAQRARRRLYLMVVSVLVPYFPVVVTIFITNIRMMGPLNPYRYEDVHHSMWDYITLMPSTTMNFPLLNQGWIPILSAIPVIIFFGMTKDAMNDYRRVLLLFGLGRFFLRLHCEYDPDIPGFADGSFGSSHSATNSGSSKSKAFASSQQLRSMSTSSGETAADPGAQLQSLNFLTSPDMEIGHADAAPLQRPRQVAQPPSSYDTTIHRNPFFFFRTDLNFPTIPFKIPSFLTSKKRRAEDRSSSRTDVQAAAVPLGAIAPD